jgi:hypothetical protein
MRSSSSRDWRRSSAPAAAFANALEIARFLKNHPLRHLGRLSGLTERSRPCRGNALSEGTASAASWASASRAGWKRARKFIEFGEALLAPGQHRRREEPGHSSRLHHAPAAHGGGTSRPPASPQITSASPWASKTFMISSRISTRHWRRRPPERRPSQEFRMARPRPMKPTRSRPDPAPALATRLAQAGSRWDERTGAMSMPIYQTASFAHPALGRQHGLRLFAARPIRPGWRWNRRLQPADGGARACAFASGLAALHAVRPVPATATQSW